MKATCRLMISVLLGLVISVSLISVGRADSLADTFASIHKSLALIVASGLGSGFVVQSSADGSYILTAAHVIGKKQTVSVYLNDDPSIGYTGSVIKANKLADLALVHIRKGNLSPMILSSDVREGESIAVAGYPYSSLAFFAITKELKPSLHDGVISAVRLGANIIEYSATTDHGNSGGPVFDTSSGYYVGVVSFSLKKANGAYEATGPTSIKSFLRSSGVQIEALNYATSATLPNTPGAYHLIVSYVTEGATNGGDVVVRNIAYILGSKIGNALRVTPAPQETHAFAFNSPADFKQGCKTNNAIGYVFFAPQWSTRYTGFAYNLSDSIKVGITDCYGFSVFRSDKSKSQALQTPITGPVIESAFADLTDQVASDISDQFSKSATIGSNFLRYGIPIGDGQVRAFFDLEPGNSGANVSVVVPFGTAARAGLQKGDLVLSINGTPMAGLSKSDLDTFFKNNENVKTYSIIVKTADGKTTTITVNKKDIRWYLSHPLAEE